MVTEPIYRSSRFNARNGALVGLAICTAAAAIALADNPGQYPTAEEAAVSTGLATLFTLGCAGVGYIAGRYIEPLVDRLF